MKLFNSYTNNVEEFKPIKEGHVDMYVCGPTVYNYAHIGNARPMVVFDVLKRLFEAEGYMSISNNYSDELVVTFKVGPSEYKKNYVYLNDLVLYL